MYLLIVEGTFEETIGRKSRTCGSHRLLYRQAGEEHAQLFGERGATCLAIELPVEPEGNPGGNEQRGKAALLAMRLYDEFARPTTETPLIVEETVATLTGSRERFEHTIHEGPPDWLNRTVDLIEARLSTTLRLRDLAAEADRHPVHVSRTFRKIYGCDVAEFVRRRRVHEACRRIREERTSLSVIAATSGFSDESHMGRAFKQVIGRSPGAYRR